MSQPDLQTECPETGLLEDYLLGLLQSPALDECESHIANCQACHETLRGLSVSDTLSEHIAKAIGAGTPDQNNAFTNNDKPQLRTLIERLIQYPQSNDHKISKDQPRRGLSSANAEILADRAAEVLRCVIPDESERTLGSVASYQLRHLIGAGSTGVVFEANDVNLHRTLALKILRPSLGPIARERFIAEARLAASIEHPNVVTIYQIGQHERLAFIAMQLLPGQTLEAKLQSGKAIAEPAIRHIAGQIASGLQAAHDRQLVHRDIKPANIWICDSSGEDPSIQSEVKILDFGLARVVDEAPNLTATGMLAGTPNFMSPEQTKGQELDGRSDLFSLGCVIYQMATGKFPFGSTSILTTLQAIQHERPAPPKSINPVISDDVSDLTMTLLEKQPANRPASARQLKTMLESERSHWPLSVARYEPTAAAKPKKLATRHDSKRSGANRQNWHRWALVTAAGCIALAAALYSPQIIRIATNQGELVIESDDPNVEVQVLQDGQVVRVLDTQTKNSFDIESGEYQLKATGQGNSFDVSPNALTIRRGQQSIVTVARQPPSSGSLAKQRETTHLRGDNTVQTIALRSATPERSTFASVPSPEEYRNKFKTISKRIAQVEQGIARWQKRIQQWKDHPDGKVNGQDIPNSDSIENARRSLRSQESSLQEYLDDQKFLHRQFLSHLLIVEKETQIARNLVKARVADNKQLSELWAGGAATQSEFDAAKLEVEQARLQLASAESRLKIYESVGAEFDIKNVVKTKEAPTASSTAITTYVEQSAASAAKTQLDSLRLQLASLSGQLGPQHPQVQAIQREIKHARLAETTRLTRRFKALKTQLASVQQSKTPDERLVRDLRRNILDIELILKSEFDTGSSQPTFKGKPFSHWIKITETERSPEILCDALLAAAELASTPAQEAQLLNFARKLAREFGTAVPGTPDAKRNLYRKTLINAFETIQSVEVIQFVLDELKQGNHRSIGFCSWLLSYSPTATDERRRQLQDAIIEQAAKLLERVVARLESGGYQADAANAVLGRLMATLAGLGPRGMEALSAGSETEKQVSLAKQRNPKLAPAIKRIFLESTVVSKLSLVQLTRAFWPEDEQVEQALQDALFTLETKPESRESLFNTIIGLRSRIEPGNSPNLNSSPVANQISFLQRLLNNQLGSDKQRARFGSLEQITLGARRGFPTDLTVKVKSYEMGMSDMGMGIGEAMDLGMAMDDSTRKPPHTVRGRAVMLNRIVMYLNDLLYLMNSTEDDFGETERLSIQKMLRQIVAFEETAQKDESETQQQELKDFRDLLIFKNAKHLLKEETRPFPSTSTLGK